MSVAGAVDRRARDAVATVLHAHFVLYIKNMYFVFFLVCMYIYIVYTVCIEKENRGTIFCIFVTYIYIYR